MWRVAWLVLIPLAIAAAYLAVLFLAQRSLLFPVPPFAGATDSGIERVRVEGNGLEAHGLFLPPVESAPPSPILMFMHGNGELAWHWVGEFDRPRAWGVGVLLAEYPGYGGAPGSPSEGSIATAMQSLYDWAAADPRVDASRIVAYGRSLGGGAAVTLALNRPVAALILESAFTSVADFASRFMAPSFLIRDRFDSRRSLPKHRGPLLVLHGRRDTIVPIAHGRELAALVPGAQFVELDCGHNDCPRQWDTIGRFLDAAGVMPRRP
jgi:pimeloyl-ACP methyl ester carboxylesterase